MSFIIEFFGHQAKALYEKPEDRRTQFATILQQDADEAQLERKYTRFDNAPFKLPYAKLKSHPEYEQKNKMYPHKAYVRRGQEA